MNKIAELARKNYPEQWNKDMLKTLVKKKRITKAEYKEITGENYSA